jgi:hypothetical protein
MKSIRGSEDKSDGCDPTAKHRMWTSFSLAVVLMATDEAERIWGRRVWTTVIGLPFASQILIEGGKTPSSTKYYRSCPVLVTLDLAWAQ